MLKICIHRDSPSGVPERDGDVFRRASASGMFFAARPSVRTRRQVGLPRLRRDIRRCDRRTAAAAAPLCLTTRSPRPNCEMDTRTGCER
ncbi:hypothetical protein EVAR_88361_1 [Eumeta japonica]|uniref:Uncharacterized protein n=1 Tax=Eumeta variegata TaxID=151549 RepID=A0A4C1XEL7_EUMVA|nr:hypothetical protein EVAR_88361_1 [Eumeta japonica]